MIINTKKKNKNTNNNKKYIYLYYKIVFNFKPNFYKSIVNTLNRDILKRLYCNISILFKRTFLI